MKKVLLQLLILICLASCSSEPFSFDTAEPLAIVVDVAAFSQNHNDIRTRASVNSGVITSFAVGDDFGLIVVDQNGTIINDNYRFMVQKTGLAYRVDAAGNVISSDVYYNENYRYIAYAPYNAKYSGYSSLDDIVAQHTADLPTLYADQSTTELYSAADLLVCDSPRLTGTQLRLTFTHAMSLIRVYYNGEQSDLEINHPADKSKMYVVTGAESFSYICPPQDDFEVYGMTRYLQAIDGSGDEITNFSYWHTYVDLKPNHLTYVSIYSQPMVSYKTAGVDMGFPSGCIWANHNLGAETVAQFKARGGAWYDADGNLRQDLIDSELHDSFDRGDYYSWGELETKYEQPAVLFDAATGRISNTGDAYNADKTAVTPLISGSKKGYYPQTYIDRTYSYAPIDGNIAGTEFDVVRNKLWKGEWRIPNEAEVDELMRNSNISVYDWYYEDNVRYAPWIIDKDAETGKYINLHPDNSELFGTDNVRPYRYLVTIFKFESKINGEVLYIPGGTWSDWSIDMLACNSRNAHGVISTTTYSSDYGGMYYFASSASHDVIECSSYMELETSLTFDDAGKITGVTGVKKSSSYVDKDGNKIDLMGLTQNGHRYTGMLIRPVYGGKNWNTDKSSRNRIHIKVE